MNPQKYNSKIIELHQRLHLENVNLMPLIIVSAMLSFFFLLSTKLEYQSGSGLYRYTHLRPIFPTDLLLFISSWFVLLLLLTLFFKGRNRIHSVLFDDSRKSLPLNIRAKLIVVVCLIIAWLPYLLTFAPGSVLGDSFSSISQASGLTPLNNHHPVAYTLIVKFFLTLAAVMGQGKAFGIFLYSLFQSLILAITISWILSFMYEEGLKIKWLVAFMLYFCFMPVFPSYAITMWKDPLFSSLLVFLSIALIKMARNGENTPPHINFTFFAC